MTEKPVIFTIMGVTGDLAQKKLFPALFDLYRKEKFPRNFHIVGFSRREIGQNGFHELVKAAIEKKSALKDKTEDFLKSISYCQGQYDDIDAYKKLSAHLDSLDEKFGHGTSSKKLFYLSVPPELYELIARHLSLSGLTKNRESSRILIEKPLGKDLPSALKLNRLLGSLFNEKQIYRIDHYLAKETVQNILTFRFSNSVFEPIWNRKHIEFVEINLFEKGGIEG
ncbi:glucose-6-phosphate dehydrogenase, partial [Candidatus Parcubacteria bacterium]|nr:glucose-6-phosphate dehydrogenase [Candidatus Parcubacteria bacterium]